jgi:hypothetical protein
MPLDTKDDKDLNPGQADYDDKFDLNDWEARAAAPDTPGDLAAQDQRDAAMKESGDNNVPYNPSSSFDDFLDSAGNEASGGDEASALASSTGVEPGASHTYNPDGKKKSLGQRIRGKITKKTGLALATGGIIGGLGIFGFSSLLPLKLVHMMDNLQSKFFSIGQDAVENRTERLFTRYVRNHVLKGLGEGCTTTRDRRCRADIVNGNSQASRLFRGWRDARLENLLAEKYGIEFGLDSKGSYVVKVGHEPPAELTGFTNLGGGALEEDFDDLFKNTPVRKRTEIRRTMKSALGDATKLKEVWFRHKVGKLAERKYHLKRCVVACDSRDNFADWKENKNKAFKIKLVERVIEPRSQSTAIIFNCLLEISSCQGDRDTGRNGEKRSVVERKLETQLADYAAKYGTEALESLLSKATQISEKGLTSYLLSKVLGDAVGKLAGKAVPYVGTIDFLVTLKQLARDGGMLIKGAKYSMYAASSAQLYMMYRSHADEIKAGKVDSALVGSFVNGTGTSDSTQGMSVSPLYNEAVNPAGSVAFLGGSAYAQSAENSYRCGEKGDGDPAPSGSLICPEESFKATGALNQVLGISGTVGGIQDAKFNIYGKISTGLESLWTSVVRPVLNLPSAVLGPAFDKFLSAAGLKDIIGEFVTQVQEWVVEQLIGNPFSPEMSGARTAQGITAGAAAMAAENSNNGLGGKEISKAETTRIVQNVEKEKRDQFAKKSLFARFFDANDSRSFTSRVAIIMPETTHGLMQSAKNYAFNPLLPTNQFADAATRPTSASTYAEGVYDATTALGIRMIGVPVNDPVLKTDPEKLTPEYCTEFNNHWFEGKGTYDNINFDGSAKEDSETGYIYHTITNPCLLEKQATGAAGGLFTDEVLEADERDLSGQKATTNSGSVTTGIDTSAQQCPTDPDITDGGIKERYGVGRVLRYKIRVCLIKGNPAFDVNVSIAKKTIDMVRAAQSAGVTLTGGGYRTFDEQVALRGENGCPDTYTSSASTCDTPTARPGESNHEEGIAIDFDGIDKKGRNCTNPGNKYWDWLKTNASRYGFTQLSNECWHWSVGGG